MQYLRKADSSDSIRNLGHRVFGNCAELSSLEYAWSKQKAWTCFGGGRMIAKESPSSAKEVVALSLSSIQETDRTQERRRPVEGEKTEETESSTTPCY